MLIVVYGRKICRVQHVKTQRGSWRKWRRFTLYFVQSGSCLFSVYIRHSSITQQLDNSQTHQLTNSSACQPINSPSPHLASPPTYQAHQLANPSTHHLTISQIYQLTKLVSLSTRQFALSPFRKFINLQARQLTNPSIHHLPTSQTRQLANSSTKNLKSIIFILQKYSCFIAILAKILAVNWANWHNFQPFASLTRSIFKRKTCILHHFAFLVWLPPHYFLRPIIRFQPLKPHFLTAILPFVVLFLMVRRGFVYAIVVHIYAFCFAFSGILCCILHHFTLRLAPKRTAFSTKTHCVLHHIALRFAPKCTDFGGKQAENWCKLRFDECIFILPSFIS